MAKTKPSWPEVAGPLAEYADGFRAELARLGYTPLTAACQLRLTAHLSRWMTAERLVHGTWTCRQRNGTSRPAARRDTRTSGPSRPSARCWATFAGSGRVPLPSAEPRRRPDGCWTGSGPTCRPNGAWHRGRSR